MVERIRTRRARLGFVSPDGQLQVNNTDPQLSVRFDILQRVTPDANTGQIRIKNLAPQSRGWLQRNVKRSYDVANSTIKPNGSATSAAKIVFDVRREILSRADTYCELVAGYDDRTGVLFSGSCQEVRNTLRDGWDTEIRIGDGLATQTGGIIVREFAPGSRIFDVVKHCVEVMGLGLGNLTPSNLQKAFGTPGTPPNLPLGLTAMGPARWFLDSILTLAKAEWFVDQGQFYIVRKGQPLDEPAIEVNPDNGLIGRPRQIGQGGVVISNLLRNDIRPGRLVRLRSDDVSGDYRADVVRHLAENRRSRFATFATLSTIEPVPELLSQ